MKLSIPQLSAEELAARLDRIKPVLEDADGLYYIEPVSPKGVAFTWEPKPTCDALDIEPLCVIRTLHSYGYYGFFKPSIAEVLAQIPADKLADTVAFKVRGPEDAQEMNTEKEALNAGFHVSQTTLYKRKLTTLEPKLDEPDDNFRLAVWKGWAELSHEKMAEICRTPKVKAWAAGESQPLMRRTRARIIEEIGAAIEDQKSDPTIEPTKEILSQLDRTFYIVEIASHNDHQYIWEQLWGYPNGRRKDLSYQQGRMSSIQPIGKLAGNTISLSITWDEIGGKQICFIHPESQVVDHRMVRKWIAKYAGKIPTTDTSNFHHMVLAVDQANQK